MAGQDFTVAIVGTVTGFDVAPINNLTNSLKQIPGATNPAVSSGQQLSNTFNQTGSAANSLNAPINTVKASTTGVGQSFTTTGTSARGLQSTLTPLGTGFGQVGTSATGTKGNLDQLIASLQTTGQKNQEVEGTTVSFGEKIALMGGFITTTIGTVFGLVEGLTGLEASQLAADRAQQRVNTSELAAQKAQDAYNKAVRQFGPDSRQAQEALVNMENKNNAVRLAEEKNEIQQKKLQEAYVSFGTEVISAAGELATFGGTISVLIGKLGLKTAVTTADTDANIANYLSAKQMEVGLTEEEIAAQGAATGFGEADAAATGLNLKMLAIIAPLVAAAALFILIETNTFGMGDAFRSVTPQIGAAIDVIVNGLAFMVNGFAALGNAISGGLAVGANAMVAFSNGLNNALAGIVQSVHDFAQDFTNGLKVIYNFFVTGLTNPMIDAWNTFMRGLVEATNATFGQLKSVMATAFAGMVNAVELIVGNINNALKTVGVKSLDPLAQSLAKAKKDLTDTGKEGATSAKVIDTSFGQISHVQTATLDFENFNAKGLYPTITASSDVGKAFHVMDGIIINNAGSIKTGAGAWLNYNSSLGNLSGTLQGVLGPALQQTSKFLKDNTKELFGFLQPAAAADDQNKKSAITIGTLSQKQKDYSAALQDSISKILGQAQATAQQVINNQFATKALADTAKALTDAAAKNQELTTELTNGTAQWNRYNTALLEGTNKYLELITKTQDAVTAQNQYNALLEQSGAGEEAFALGLDRTAKNMELVTKAALGDSDAMKELQDSVKGVFDNFIKLGDEVGNKLAGALEEGHKAFKKTLKEMEKETGIKFDPDGVFNISVDASIREAEKTAKTGIGLIVNDIVGGWSSGIRDANLPNEIDALMTKISGQIKGSSPEVRASFQKVMDDLKAIAKQPVPTPASLTQLKKDLDAIDPSGQLAAKAIGALQPALNGVGGAAGTATGPVDQFNASLQQAGTLGSVWQITLQNIAVAFNTGFNRGVSDAIGQLNLLQQAGAVVFVAFIPALAAVAAAMNLAFVRGVGDAIGQLNFLQQAAGTVFLTIVAGLEQVVQGFNIAFNEAAKNAGIAMNSLTVNINGNVANWIKAIASATTALVNDFNAATKTAGVDMNSLATNINGNVANYIKAFNAAATALTNAFNTGTKNAGVAMNSLATNVTGNVNNMVSRLNLVTGAFNNIRSSINSATSAVSALISRINAIPTSKTVTVTINEVHHITNVVRTVPGLSVGASTTTTTGPGGTTSTTTLSPGIAPASGKRIIVEVREPTIIKIDSRELIKLINKKLLELDIGALL